MYNKKLPMRPFLALTLLSALLASPAALAEIYKWVDANGKTHYSSNAAEAGVAPVKELKVDAAPTGSAAQAEGVPAWKKQEAGFRQRQASRNAEEARLRNSGRDTPAATWKGGTTTDSARCSLARDILSGSATLTNGQKTDNHGRELAERDIAKNCH